MGYLYNHLATVVTGIFASVLTGLWPLFVDAIPVIHFIFLMAVPITWFLTLMCWLAQKSNDYTKQSHNSKPVYTSEGKLFRKKQLLI